MLQSIVSSPFIANIAQNTAASVSTETVLKSIGRPGFILIDKDIDGDTKQYAAAKEFLYQMTCLAIYAALITPVFKAGAFKLGKKFFKNSAEFAKFKNADEYLKYHKQAVKDLKTRKAVLMHPGFKKTKERLRHDNLVDDLYNKEKPEKYEKIKGTIELGSLVGSVLGLAVIAPQIAHFTIHPILKALGLEKKEHDVKQNNSEQHSEHKLDKVA